jgi:hypothetical protein
MILNTRFKWLPRGRCYDHNFLRFSSIFGEKTNVMIQVLHNLAVFRVRNANFFAEILGENILKVITSVPGANPTTSQLQRRRCKNLQRHE